MLGRRKPAKATTSAAIAQRRLDAIASSFIGIDETPPAGSPDAAGSVPTESQTVPARVAAGRHVAPTLPPARRLTLTTHQITLVALAVAAVVAVAAWWVLRAVPHAEPVQLAQQRVLPTEPSSSLAASDAATHERSTSAATTTAPVVVDVAGKVLRPGIVELPAGSRVVDALKAAGGARPGVDTAALNLARLLIDGEQIVVGLEVPTMPASPSSGSSTASALTPINLNTATQEQLETLPGIGPVTAQAILAWRTDNGAFSSVDELLEVSGIGDATLADIEAYVYV
jgi:competence protein ComEA